MLENSYLALDAVGDDQMTPLLGHFIKYRIAGRPTGGMRKVFTSQTLPASDEPVDGGAGKVAGFTLHAAWRPGPMNVRSSNACAGISQGRRSSEKRPSLTPSGNIRYQLKIPQLDGSTHVIFEPLDFIARLAALVLKPRVNLTRFHGVFAPNSKHRASVTPAKRGKGNKPKAVDDPQERTPVERRAFDELGVLAGSGSSISTSRPAGNAAALSRLSPASKTQG